MKTSVVYNTVSLSNVETGAISTEAVYDPSGNIVVAWRTRMEFSGTVHADAENTFNANLSSLRTLLLTPRKLLQVTLQEPGLPNVNAFWVYPTGSGVVSGGVTDCADGPKPISATIDKMIGGRTAVVRFTVEFAVAAVVNASAPKVIGHRFRQELDVDELSYTHRVVTGSLFFSTAFAISDAGSVDLYRSMIYPKSIPGFITSRAQFIVNEAMTQMDYVVEQREAYRKFPGVAMSGSGHYTTRIEDGKLRAAFSITLSGTKSTNPGDLTNAAFNAMRARISFADPAAGGDIIRVIEFDEDLFANTVTLRVQAETGMGPNGEYFNKSNHFLPLENLTGNNADGVPLIDLFNQPSPFGSAAIAGAAQSFFDITDSAQTNPPTTPAGIGAIERARVIAATNPDGSQVGVAAIQIAGQGDIQTVVNSIKITDATALLSPAQQAANRYNEIAMGFNVEVNNRLVRLSAADPSQPDEVQQIGKPYATEHWHGVLTRTGSLPVIPRILGTINAGGQRRGYIENWRTRTYSPPLEGNVSSLIYRVEYEYDVVIPWNSTDFGVQILPQGRFIVYLGPTVNGQVFPESPALGSDSLGIGIAPNVPIPVAIVLEETTMGGQQVFKIVYGASVYPAFIPEPKDHAQFAAAGIDASGLNFIRWPVGLSRHAYGELLVTQATLARILADGSGSPPGPCSVVLGSSESPIILQGMIMLAPRPISVMGYGDASSAGTSRIYSLPVVDRRYFLNARATNSFNVTGPAGAGIFGSTSQSATSLSFWSYDQAVASLASDLGVTVNIADAGITSSYPYCYSTQGKPAAEAIDELLAESGRVCVARFDGTFYAENVDHRTIADVLSPAAGRIISGSADWYVGSPSGWLAQTFPAAAWRKNQVPPSVAVQSPFFLRVPFGGSGIENGLQIFQTNATYTASSASLQFNSANSPLIVQDSTPGLGTGATPINSGLLARANDLAQAFYRRFVAGQMDRVQIAGAFAPAMGGSCLGVEWTISDAGGCRTFLSSSVRDPLLGFPGGPVGADAGGEAFVYARPSGKLVVHPQQRLTTGIITAVSGANPDFPDNVAYTGDVEGNILPNSPHHFVAATPSFRVITEGSTAKIIPAAVGSRVLLEITNTDFNGNPTVELLQTAEKILTEACASTALRGVQSSGVLQSINPPRA